MSGADVAGGNWAYIQQNPTKAVFMAFRCWISLKSQVVEISWYRDIRVGTSLATKRSAVEMVLMIGRRHHRTITTIVVRAHTTNVTA